MIKQELIIKIKSLRDLEITAARESREYEFKDERARLNWVREKTETSKAYNTILKFAEQLDEPKTCHMKKSYQGQDIKDITIACSECGGHLGSTANAVKHFTKFCKNCGAKIDFAKGVEL